MSELHSEEELNVMRMAMPPTTFVHSKADKTILCSQSERFHEKLSGHGFRSNMIHLESTVRVHINQNSCVLMANN